MRRGVKEVVKAVRKSPIPAANTTVTPPGVVVLAGDISPMDVISHIPILCEDHGIPYIFVSSRAELGLAGATKRPTSAVMITLRPAGKKNASASTDDTEYSKTYDELAKAVEKENRELKF